MDIKKQIQLVLNCLFRFVLRPAIILFFKFYHGKIDKIKPLPPVKSPLLLMPACVLAKKIRSKEVTSTEVVQAYVARIKEVNPLINCAVVTCFDEAIEQAKVIDQILTLDPIPDEYSEKNKPLLGIPFSCKESIFCKDKPNSAGLIARKNTLAKEDANPVRYMREAGAILLCLTNTSELCMWIESRNLLYGISRNPYNLSRIVGGSSGGEGCLLSAACSVIGIGSDIGGSIRMPAFFNGVFGLKTSYALINTRKQFPCSEGYHKTRLVSTGPMCRYASDLKLLTIIQADKDRFAEVKHKFDQKVDPKSLNYYVLTDLKDCPQATKQSQSCRDALDKAVSFIETSLSVKVKKLELDGFQHSYKMWSSLMSNGEQVSTTFSDTIKASTKSSFIPIIELFKSAFGMSQYSFPAIAYSIVEKVPKKDPIKYIEIRDEMVKELDTILGYNGVIIAPGFPCVAPYHSQPFLTNTFDFIYYGVWNALGLPVAQCPMGLCSKTGLPLGIQIVSNANCDHLSISLAEYFEQNGFKWTAGF